jgi:NitT/TauT family transport system substrate-binding protein
MKFATRKFHQFFMLGLLLTNTLVTAPCQAEAYFDRYPLTVNSPPLDIGVQPLGYPSGVISSVMQRDRILRRELEKLGQPLKAYGFRRGADMISMIRDGRLEAALLGDMPTILSAIDGEVWIVGLVKKTSTALVARNESQIQRLKGRRIAYVETSSAHHTLLQGLASVGLTEKDVTLIPIGVEQMPSALERNEIDAFAAWEPAPSTALSNNPANKIVFRGLSSDYFVINRSFQKQHPEAALILTAGFVRAIEWMRQSTANIEQGIRWTMIDGELLSGRPPEISIAQGANITRREILNIPSAPTILIDANEQTPLSAAFAFLKQRGKISPSNTGANLLEAFAYDGLAQVIKDPRRYGIKNFDYEQTTALVK